MFSIGKCLKNNILLLLVLLVLCSNNALAGSQQNTQIKHSPEAVAEFAKGVEKYAASKGARAFIVSRVGRPAEDLPRGILFTHIAIAVYSNIQLNNGETVQGYAIHNLYQKNDDNGQSILVTDYPVDFFWGAHRLHTGIIIPTPSIQSSLIELINNGSAKALHNPKYSVLANPFNNEYQNCTEYTLDLVNASVYKTNNMQQLKVNAKAYFAPQRIYESRFKLALGSAFSNGLSIADHSGKVKTATFSSIAKYMQKFDLAEHVVTLNQNLEARTLGI